MYVYIYIYIYVNYTQKESRNHQVEDPFPWQGKLVAASKRPSGCEMAILVGKSGSAPKGGSALYKFF